MGINTALTFASSTTDRVTLPTTFLDNVDPATFVAWVTLRTLSQNAVRIMTKNAGAARHNFFPQDFIGGGAGYGLELFRGRATTSLDIHANWTNFFGATANIPMFLAGQSDLNTAGNNRLFVGTQSIPAAEPSSYSVQTNGSGTATSNAGQVCLIGNQDGQSFSLQGAIHWLGVWNATLSLAELLDLQHHPLTSPLLMRALAWWMPGTNGAGPVLDLTGKGNHGLITGAMAVSNNLPIVTPRLPRRYWDIGAVTPVGRAVPSFTLLGVT